MTYRADTMFPGDLHEAAARFAANAQAVPLATAWHQARDMAWPTILVDEARGGAGGTLADLAAVLEACARQGSKLPLLRRCALAPALLISAAAAGTGAESMAASDSLKALCRGDLDLDVALGCRVSVAAADSGWVRLSGEVELADAALPFSHILLSTPSHLILLPREAMPATWERQHGLDGRCTADVPLQGLRLPASAVLASGPAAATAAQSSAALAAFMTAVEMAATLGALLEHSMTHLRTRVQFGVALATFQVLRHKAVELYVQYEAASVMLARQVADTMRSGQLSSRDARLAKLYLNDLARRGAEAAIQLHGGMGMTTELPATRLAQRLLAAQFEYGERLALLDALEHPDSPCAEPPAFATSAAAPSPPPALAAV